MCVCAMLNMADICRHFYTVVYSNSTTTGYTTKSLCTSLCWMVIWSSGKLCSELKSIQELFVHKEIFCFIAIPAQRNCLVFPLFDLHRHSILQICLCVFRECVVSRCSCESFCWIRAFGVMCICEVLFVAKRMFSLVPGSTTSIYAMRCCRIVNRDYVRE